MSVGLIDRFRDRLPFEDGDPVITLGEGSTPLVHAEHVSELVGAEVWLKLEGSNPTGSFKDRGMTCAVSAAVREGAEAVICASTGNTAASAAAYAARAGLTRRRDRARRAIATGKLAQALMHGARVVALRGNFDEALALVRELCAKHPIALVNSVNPFRLEGQKTACVRGHRGPRRRARRALHPGRQRRQRHGVVARLRGGGRSRLACSASRPRAPRRSSRAPVAKPETIASAIRIGNPARWEEAMEAMTASRGTIRAVTDDEILDAWRLLAGREGVFCEPGQRRVGRRAAALRRRRRRPDRVRAHRPRPQGPADRARPRRRRRAVRAAARAVERAVLG